MKKLLATIAAISTLSASIAQAADKDLILARECRNILAVKQNEPYTVKSSYTYYNNKRFVGNFCEDVHSFWKSKNVLYGTNSGCAVQNNITETKITLEGKTRFGEEDNRSFTCYFTGRDYKLHTVYKHGYW